MSVARAIGSTVQTRPRGQPAFPATQAAVQRVTAPAGCIAPPQGTRFLLEIIHDIKRSDLPIFQERGAKLVKLITTDNFKLERACWHVSGDVARLVNYWDLGPNINSLFDTEIRLPDMPEYQAYDRLMLSETKNVVVSITPQTEPLDPIRADRGHVYLRVATNVRSPDLAELAARLERDLRMFARRNGWMLGDTYYGLTGQAGEVVQLWLIPDGAVHMAENRLTATSWHALFGTTKYTFFERAPYDPNVCTQPQGERS